MLLLLGSQAFAGQTVTGDMLRISYYDTGNWAWGRAGAAVEVYLDGGWVDFVWPGDAHSVFAVEFDEDGVPREHYADSFSGVTTLDVLSEQDISTTSDAIAEYTYLVDGLSIVKLETWDLAASSVFVEVRVTNDGVATVDNIRFFFATDPDPDHAQTGSYDTYNVVMDTNGDGVDDYVQSEGTGAGYTMGFGACDASSVELGHYSDWLGVTDADTPLADGAGAQADDAMGLRMTPSVTLAPGESWEGEFVVTMGDSAEDAWSRYEETSPRCCDGDQDGAMSADCGGADCDDEDPEANPDAEETWYDGIDQNCDGNDTDADGDGSPVGTDCDDTNPAVTSPTAEVCDGVDNDCDGVVDDGVQTTYYQDNDGDGYGNVEVTIVSCFAVPGYVTQAGDCDDDDLSVSPGYDEVCDNGADDNCDGRTDEGCDTARPDTDDTSPDETDRPDSASPDSASDKGENPPKCGEGSGGWLILLAPWFWRPKRG